ncbi:MAG: cell division protein FtsA, partial [Bacilli bacterium]
IDQTVLSIREAVEAAERMAGCSVRHVILSIPANNAALHNCNGIVAISGSSDDGVPEISSEDIIRVFDHARVISVPKEREIIDIVPRQFVIDGVDGVQDPRGLSGLRLEMEGTVVTTSRIGLSNTLRAVHKAGLEVVDYVFGPHAVSAIAISNEDKDQGVALVDMGGSSTTVSVYQQGRLLGTSHFPFGGDVITKDIATVYGISTRDAETIKLNYGHAFLEEALRDVEFDLPNTKRPERSNQYELADIIEARFEEMLTIIINEMVQLGAYELPSGVIFTGGTFCLPGALACANRRFNVNVTIGYPDYIGVREPKFTTSVGTIFASYQTAKLRSKKVSSGQISRTSASSSDEISVPDFVDTNKGPKENIIYTPFGEEKSEREPKKVKEKKPKNGPKILNFVKSLWE